MNNEVFPTTYLGRELPKEYVNSIEKGESFPEWLTMFPHTEYEHSTEIEVWSKEFLFGHTLIVNLSAITLSLLVMMLLFRCCKPVMKTL